MLRLILPGLVIAAFGVAPAVAETLNRSLDGTQLQLRLSCVKSVEIDPKPDLQGKVEIDAEAESRDELTPLDFTGGTVAKIQRKGDCRRKSDDVTLTLAIKVPPGTPIDLHDAGSGDYRIGPVGAALKIVLAGSGDVQAEQSTALDLSIAGSGNLDLARLDGPGKIDIRGSGDAKIETGAMPSLEIDLRGSGDAEIGDGQIGTLTASIAGSGDIDIAGTVNDARLTTTGSGDISLAKATGKVEQHQDGSGSISVGD